MQMRIIRITRHRQFHKFQLRHLERRPASGKEVVGKFRDNLRPKNRCWLSSAGSCTYPGRNGSFMTTLSSSHSESSRSLGPSHVNILRKRDIELFVRIPRSEKAQAQTILLTFCHDGRRIAVVRRRLAAEINVEVLYA